jgi:flavin reductase (DIM6/NTAB) family NADH-FMN oxidoreductase RutF
MVQPRPYAEAMTIHGDHPFADPDAERDPARRLRGRLGGAVSLWTSETTDHRGRTGLTVSSLMVAAGEPAHVVALIDPDSDLAIALDSSGRAVVQILEWRHQQLAEAFAGRFPSPGGPFRMGEWEDTRWGPRLADASTWAGVRVEAEARRVGWYTLIDAVVEHVEVGDGEASLVHRRGSYERGS